MRLRPYIPSRDFDIVRGWVTDRREHALWCADRFCYPLERENFDSVLAAHSERFTDCAFVATEDNGRPLGFFCYSVNTATNEGMLKFVVNDPLKRGRGVGKEMISLALRYAFDFTKAEMVKLYVFGGNIPAQKCYESVGFTEEGTDSVAFMFGEEPWYRCLMTKKK